jgi:hypothetical protein
MNIVGAIRDDDRHAICAYASEEESEQIATRLISPVRVLDDEYDRLLACERCKRQIDGFKKLAAINAIACEAFGPETGNRTTVQQATEDRQRLLEFGNLSRGIDLMAAERLHERQIRRWSIAKIQAVAGEDEVVLGGELRANLGKQASLADACITIDDRDRGHSGCGRADSGQNRRALGRPADESAYVAGHLFIVA